MAGAVAAETSATPADAALRRWSREAGRLDWLAVIAAAALAPWTLWTAAVPVLRSLVPVVAVEFTVKLAMAGTAGAV